MKKHEGQLAAWDIAQHGTYYKFKNDDGGINDLVLAEHYVIRSKPDDDERNKQILELSERIGALRAQMAAANLKGQEERHHVLLSACNILRTNLEHLVKSDEVL